MCKLILGNRDKYKSLLSYCDMHNISYVIFDPETHKHFFTPRFYIDYILENELKIDQIINFRDQKTWLDLENRLNQLLLGQSLDSNTLDFFSYKSKQDQICKRLGIPTIPFDKNNLCIVKKDAGFSGGTDFYKSLYKDVKDFDNVFLQNYINIDYTIAVQFYIKNNKWHPFCCHKVSYEDNCPIHSVSPHIDIEYYQIVDYAKLLANTLDINNRLVFWQFVKSTDGYLYNMDFNCRPAGGFENGSYDTEIANHNVLDYLLDRKSFPNQIKFDKSVEIIYNSKQQFGYTDYRRVVNTIQEKIL